MWRETRERGEREGERKRERAPNLFQFFRQPLNNLMVISQCILVTDAQEQSSALQLVTKRNTANIINLPFSKKKIASLIL